jgi:hypothetical protein
MPLAREIVKNKREKVRVGPSMYGGYELIDIRIYAPVQGSAEMVPTKKGVTINVDAIPEVIVALEWALAQDCAAEAERPLPSPERADELAQSAWAALGAHGSAVHWDAIERMLKDRLRKFSKWDLHYVLATRRDLFQSCGGGTFRAIGYKKSRT